MGAALARSTFLSNLPTEVLGTSSMKRTSSGSHHLATLSRRKSMISSCVTLPLNSGLGTAYATGRSSHLGWTRPITAAWSIPSGTSGLWRDPYAAGLDDVLGAVDDF